MFGFLVDLQRTIHLALTSDIAAFADSRDWVALLAMLPLGIVFGAAHALTPGHSKVVLATYIAGSTVNAFKALATALVLAGTHIASAVILAVSAQWLVSRTLTSVGQAPALEWVSRLLLLAAGLWLVARAIKRRPHVHGEGVVVGFMAGLVPCPLTLLLMFYATSRGVPEAGLTFAAAMVVGVGSVLVTVALASVFARSLAVSLASNHGLPISRASQAVEIIAGAVLVLLAGADLLSVH